MLTLSTPSWRSWLTDCTARLSSARPRCTPGSSLRPASVSSIRRPWRWNSAWSSRSSRARICDETAAGVTFRASAPLAKLSRVATASKVRRALSGMADISVKFFLIEKE